MFSIKYMYFPIDISSHQVGRHLWFNAPLRLNTMQYMGVAHLDLIYSFLRGLPRLVLVCLSKICDEKQTLVDLYLNYDCDEFLSNVFERMIGDLGSIAQVRSLRVPLK